MDPGILYAIQGLEFAVAATLGTVEATYSRGDQSCTVELTCTQSSAWFASPEDGISTRINHVAFQCRPEEIDFGAGAEDPEDGDRLGFTAGGWAYVYEVRPPRDGEPCFAPVDPFCVMYRLHGKLLSRTRVESSSESSVESSSESSEEA